jgi:hypothetical protein
MGVIAIRMHRLGLRVFGSSWRSAVEAGETYVTLGLDRHKKRGYENEAGRED